MGQADLSLGDGALTPYPGLAATLAHGRDFFDRPSGVVIPQFASSLSASLDPQSASNALQASSSDQDDASTSSTTTSSRDYDHFSDPVASSSPAASAYDQFSDAVGSAPRSVGGLFSDAVASSQVTPAASSDSSQTVASESAARKAGGSSSDAVANSPPASSPYDQFSDAVGSAPRSVGGFFSDAVASSQVGPGTSDGSFGAAASDAAPRSVGGLFSDAVASSQIGPGAQSDPVWDLFGEVAASAPVGRALGAFADKAMVTFGPSFKDFGDYLSASAESLAQAPRDIAGYASDLVDDPIDFLRRANPTFAGLGISMPTIGVGASTGTAALRGGPAAAEEISALAAPSEALLSRSLISAEGAAGGSAAVEGTEAAGSLAQRASAAAERELAAGESAAGNTDPAAAWRALSPSEKLRIKQRLQQIFKDSKEVVYDFMSNGLRYVGQTSRGFQRMVEHLYKGKLHPDDIESILFDKIPGGKFAREVAERARIEALGGLEKTANKILPVSNARLSGVPPPPPFP